MLGSLISHFEGSFIGMLHWFFDHLFPLLFWGMLFIYPKSIDIIVSHINSNSTPLHKS